MAWPITAGGLCAGCCCVQVEPSHVQVSAIGAPALTGSGTPVPPEFAPVEPPNRTTWRWTGSFVLAPALSGGGDVAGDSCVQSLPSHSQVSLNTFPWPSNPP